MPIRRHKRSVKHKKRRRLSRSTLKHRVKHRSNCKYDGGGIEKLPEKIDNVALLIPVYPKHYSLMYRLLNKLKDNKIDIDVYCIFSNKGEYDTFTMKDMVKEIIPDSVPDDKSVIEYKRLYGLKRMIDKSYDYIISCVSETDIVPENFTKENISKKLSDIFTNKRLYGINMPDPFIKEIMTACANVYTGEDYKKIETATNNLRLYTYFYDIPVYKREHIQDFLDTIKYDTLKLTWFNFDNLMHDYYLVTHQGFEMVDVSKFAQDDMNGLYTENMEGFDGLKSTGFGFGNAGSKFWKLMHTQLMGEKTFLLINTDRP
jgi:hypothetical protein